MPKRSHEFKGSLVLRPVHAASEGKQPLLGIGFDADVDPDQSQPLAQRGQDLRIEVVGASFDDAGEIANSALVQLIAQRMDASQSLRAIGQEEIIIVKGEELDPPLVIQRCHFVGDVLHRPQAKAFAGLRLFMPGGDTTKGAIPIAAATGNERGHAVSQALTWRSAAVRGREFVQVRQGRQFCQPNFTLGVAVSQAGDRR